MLSSLEKASPKKRRIGRGSVWHVESRDLEQSCLDGSEETKSKGLLQYEKTSSTQVGSSEMVWNLDWHRTRGSSNLNNSKCDP